MGDQERPRGKQRGDTQRTVWRDETVPVFFADGQQTENGKTEKGEPESKSRCVTSECVCVCVCVCVVMGVFVLVSVCAPEVKYECVCVCGTWV